MQWSAFLHPPTTPLNEGAIASRAVHKTIERRQLFLAGPVYRDDQTSSVIPPKPPTPIDLLGGDTSDPSCFHRQAIVSREWVSRLTAPCQRVAGRRVENVQFSGSAFHCITKYVENFLDSRQPDILLAPDTSPGENHLVR